MLCESVPSTLLTMTHLKRRPKDLLVADSHMDWLHSELQTRYENDGMAPYSPPNCRIATKKAMSIIRNRKTVIEDALKNLNLKIITKDVEKNGNSLLKAIKISYLTKYNPNGVAHEEIIQEMVEKKIDNPLALFLRIWIKMDPEELHKTREEFISRNTNLPKHEVRRIWYEELYQSSGDSIIVQTLSQILWNDIIIVDRDLSSIQVFKGGRWNHEPIIILKNEGFYFPLRPTNKKIWKEIFKKQRFHYYYIEFYMRDCVKGLLNIENVKVVDHA